MCFIGVNMRSKKKRIGVCNEEDSRDGLERPMSWEGELSDSEMPSIKQVTILVLWSLFIIYFRAFLFTLLLEYNNYK